MEAKGNGLDSAANTNILVTKDGNYTLTLITAEDNAKTELPSSATATLLRPTKR